MKIERIPVTAQRADIFTKPLKATLYKKNKNHAQVLLKFASASQNACQGECGSLQNPSTTLGQLAPTIFPSRVT